jgi:8-oxo-dGTP pyrophosphatase MutT (NUDIX family)
MKQKVAAFILREKPSGKRQILLQSFVTAPNVPLRLPGGGVHEGETIAHALFRELQEETGLTNLRIERKLGVQSYFKDYIQAQVERHDFLLWADNDFPDEWIYQVQGSGEDAGDIFRLQWHDPHVLTGVDEEYRPFIVPAYLPELFITT